MVFVKLYVQFFFVGLGPRKFRTTKSDTGDRSVWTDTPADRLKRAEVVGDSFMTKMFNIYIYVMTSVYHSVQD